jgi:hypothetical protein
MTAGINKKFPCRENSVAITKLERARTDRSGETAIGGSMTTAINKHLDEIEKWFDDPAADIANITDVIPPLIAALRLSIDGLRRYAGREVDIGDGYCRLRCKPTPDAPSMCFYEGETWRLGAHADDALKDIAEKLEVNL